MLKGAMAAMAACLLFSGSALAKPGDGAAGTFEQATPVAAINVAANPASAEAQFRKAMELVRKGDQVGMAKILKVLAADGYPLAMGTLGLAYLNGEGVPVDDNMANALLTKAAAAGSPVGFMGLGQMYAFGFGVRPDFDVALQWLHRAESAGAPGLAPLIAEVERRRATLRDIHRSCPSGTSAASDPPNRAEIVGLSFVPPAGDKWCLPAAAPGAMFFKIGYERNAGRIVADIPVPELAHTFVLVVARVDVQGGAPQTPDALLRFAKKWMAKDGPSRSLDSGKEELLTIKPLLTADAARFTLTKWAAARDTSFGMDCVRVDVTETEKDNQYYPGEQTMLITDYLCLNLGTGSDLFRISVSERFMAGRRGPADLMNMDEVQVFLSSMRLSAPLDDSDALARFTASAERARSQAQYALGVHFEATGEYAKALGWYRRSAAQRHPDAEYKLGVFLGQGRGGSRDTTEAVRWLRLAADDGSAAAHVQLAAKYEIGSGVELNLTRAAMHLEIALAHLPAGPDRDAALAANERIAGELGTAQVGVVKAMAAVWRPGEP